MAKCLSNMRQIGAAMGMYQGYHRGWLPVGPVDKMLYIDKYVYPPQYYDTPQSNTNPFPWSNCHWGGRRAAKIHYYRSEDQDKEEERPRPLTRYIYPHASLDSNTEVFECPSDVGSEYWKPFGSIQPYYYLCGNTYWTNPWPERDTDGQDRRRQLGPRRMRQVSSIVVVEEPLMYLGLARKKEVDGYHGQFSRHNMLFLDFHAEYKRVDTSTYYGPGWFVMSYWEIMDYYR
jgi:hypothetical protein